MDPKQTEGQNSGPGNAPAGGFSFSSEPANNTANNSGTLSTGANVARAMSDLNSNRKSATQNSPFAKHQFQKVAPRTGDILIDPSGNIITEEPKQGINRGRLIQFGLIFGGIALVALAIFTVVMVINNRPKDTKPATVAQTAETTFSQYVNYIVDGSDGTVPTEESQIFLQMRALFSVEDGTLAVGEAYLSDKDDRNDYISNLHEKYNTFANLYDGEYKDVIYNIDLFYYNYLNIPTISKETLVEKNNTEGVDAVRNFIDENTISLDLDQGYNYYLDAYRDYLLSFISVLEEANNVGCTVILANDAIDGCATTLASFDNYQSAYQNYRTAYHEYMEAAGYVANTILDYVYEELFGEVVEVEEEEQQ